METHANNNKGFLQRLDSCVERVGGKRALATATLISEAQLFRYLGGDSILPTDRLMSIAKAANVDAGWLLTGLGDAEGIAHRDPRPSFRPELLLQITQVFEELLVEYDKPFNPRQRARAITYMYDALRHEEVKRNTQLTPQKFDLLKYTNFLAELRTEDELEVLMNAMHLLEYSGEHINFNDHLQLLGAWCNLTARGWKGYYSSYPGQVYFERMGYQLDPQALNELHDLITRMIKVIGKPTLELLDIGCGNGRHLAHIHGHMPNITGHGIELSQLGYDLCQQLIQSEKLAKGSITLGNACQMPYESERFDLAMARLSLHGIPYLPGTGLGLEQAVDEIYRVLKPKGVAILILPYGDWLDYLLPRQHLNQDMARKLIERSSKFKLLSCTVSVDGHFGNKKSDIPMSMSLMSDNIIRIEAQKL